MPQNFDVKAARAAGYSDDEILNHLKGTRNFDVDGAVTAGYSKAEVIDHLAGTALQQQPKQPAFGIGDASSNLRTEPGQSGWRPNWRDDISRSEKAANQTLNVAEGLGVAPELSSLGFDFPGIPGVIKTPMRFDAGPVMSTGRNLIRGLADSYKRGEDFVPKFPGTAPLRGAAGAVNALKDIAAGVVMSPVHAIKSLASGDWEEAARGAGQFAASVPVAAAEINAVRRLPAATRAAATAVGEATPTVIKKPVQAVAERTKNLITGVPASPEETLVKALKPRAKDIKFDLGLQRSMPELKAVELQTGKVIENMDDLLEAIGAAKKNVWGQYGRIAGPQMKRGVDLSPVADAMVRSIPFKAHLENPALANSIAERASLYRRPYTLAQIDELRRTTNAELQAYYDKYPAAQRGAAAKSPETALLSAQADALRDVLYKSLDSEGGGAVPREINLRYKSLIDLEDVALRRRNVAMRQQPESLTEQMGRLGAAFEVGKAAFELPFAPFKAASRVAGAYAGRKAAGLIKEANSTNSLIGSALKRFTLTPEPIPNLPQSFQDMVGRQPLLLDRGSIPMGPAPDPSGSTTTTPWEELRSTQKALPAPSERVVARMIQPSSGQVFEMPPALKGLLPEKAGAPFLLPKKAGGPFVTPLRESLLDAVRRMQTSRGGRRSPLEQLREIARKGGN